MPGLQMFGKGAKGQLFRDMLRDAFIIQGRDCEPGTRITVSVAVHDVGWAASNGGAWQVHPRLVL